MLARLTGRWPAGEDYPCAIRARAAGMRGPALVGAEAGPAFAGREPSRRSYAKWSSAIRR
jgi:hypothetical protein